MPLQLISQGHNLLVCHVIPLKEIPASESPKLLYFVMIFLLVAGCSWSLHYYGKPIPIPVHNSQDWKKLIFCLLRYCRLSMIMLAAVELTRDIIFKIKLVKIYNLPLYLPLLCLQARWLDNNKYF